MMQKSKIEWTEFSWNPIKGICPVGCWYCYARRMYQRFGWNPEIRIAEEYPEIIPMPMYDNKGKQISRKVFVCSTFELFHPSVKKEWRDWIFDNIKYNFHLTFQILTKFPENIDRPMPDNVWLGMSITDPHDAHRLYSFGQIPASLRFVSFEPILRDFNPFNYPDFGIKDEALKWIIIGRLTGHGNKYNPTKETIEKICCWARSMGAKIFLKDNLKKIWKEPLIQEFPG